MTSRLRMCFSILLIAAGLCSSLHAQDPEVETDSGLQMAPEALDGADALVAESSGSPASGQTAEIEWLRAAEPDTVVCPFRGRIDYDPGEIECGLIRVPENRERAGSRTIELNYVRILATGKNHEDEAVDARDDPVIYLTGGPGVTVDVYVERFKDHRLIAQRDLYVLEQRGIGNSGDFCPFYDDLNRAEMIHLDREASERAALDQAQACIEAAIARGVDVTGYNTFENAHDIKALRLALGLDEWNVWGISYGSVLAQAYIKVDPEGIRAAVIDAIVPLDLGELMRISHWHHANLDRLFGACQEQPGCARAYDGLRARYMEAIAALQASPVIEQIEPNELYPQGEVPFFSAILAGLPFSLMYEQETHPALPAIIDGLTRAMDADEQTFFQALAQLMSMDDGMGSVGISMGMSVAVRCQDGYVDSAAAFAEQDAGQYPVLFNAFSHPVVVQEASQRCRDIGLIPRDMAQYSPVQTALPVLVVNGRWDPITPVELAEYILPGFENGELVVFPHAGHGPTRSVPCAGDWMNDWFDDPSAPVDRECVDEGESAAEFIAPYFKTSVVVDALAMMNQDEDRLKVHGIWAGSSAGLTLLAALFLPLAWVGRKINGHNVQSGGGSRLLVFLAASSATVWLAGLGFAAYTTSEVTEAMLLFGLVPWAVWFAWLGPVSLILGLLALGQTWRNRARIPIGSRIGLIVAGAGVVSLAVAGQVWSLWSI